MQEELNNIFDQAVRSALENAEVEVPSRSWGAIESRLNRQRALLWWKVAGVSLAAAAAVLLGIFFTGTKPSAPAVSIDNSIQVQPLAQNVTEQPSEALVAELPATPETAAALAKRPAAATQAAQPAKAPMPAAEPAVPSTPADEPASTETKTNTNKITTEKTINDEEPWEDSFAKLLADDAGKAKRKVSVEAKGLLGSNGELGAKASRPMMASAPGTSLLKTGIAESSQSLYGLPLTVGLGARFYVSDKLSVGTGLNYSLLTRSFDGIYTNVSGADKIKTDVSSITHTLQYVGIPVNVYFDLISNKLLSFYVFTGGEVERAISNKYRIHAEDKNYSYSESVSGVQASAAVGLGLELGMTDHLGLYIDPSARYYFDCNQPKNVRTLKPLMFNFELGLRFKL